MAKKIDTLVEIDGFSFFMKKMDNDANFKADIKSQIHSTSKKDLKQEIEHLRGDINNVLRPPKVYISVKELENSYCISESQQKGLRGRIKNPLPFYQDGQGGKIRYKVSEIEEWMNQQKIKRGI